ncbi:olfactory receptor 5B12-like [Gastrophryne carolinensis]
MVVKNETQVTMFLFSGLTDNEDLYLFLFVLFLLMYVVTIIGNVGMMTLIYSFPSLQTPMYYFLSNLSLVDLLYSSTVTPNMLYDLLSCEKSITFLGCALQFYFFAAVASTELFLLSNMSYDRYVAICHPLHYTLIMSKKKCRGLILYSCSFSFLQSLVQTVCMFRLPFCRSNVIDHFFCDVPPLLKLSCENSLHCDMVTAVIVGTSGMYVMMTILLPYIFIISAVLRITSATGRQKAFSTCFSHIVCVLTIFTAIFFVYLRPNANAFDKQGKVACVFYTIVSPMLNPFIYSLRNQEVKRNVLQAIKKCCR